MRIAVYGLVDKDKGSVAGAGYWILRTLLDRSHEIVFIANQRHVPSPPSLEGYPNYSYIGLDPGWLETRIPYSVRRFTDLLVGTYWGRTWEKRHLAAALPEHYRSPFDVQLTLGVPPPFTIERVPVVSWLQGPRMTELNAIEELRQVIERSSGRLFYLGLVAYYRAKLFRERHRLDSCNEIICGSQWAIGALRREGIPGEMVHAIPYPIDLSRFSSTGTVARSSAEDGPTLLSIGRLDPRKRLDLLVASFELLSDEFRQARLKIVGRPGYAPRQLDLIERSRVRGRIDYIPEVPQQNIPALMKEADVLLQTSQNENFGSAVAEALACGVSVVVGPTNGTSDYIDDSSAVFAEYAAEAVAQATRKVLQGRLRDPGAAARTSRKAAEHWFGVDAVTDAVEEVLWAAKARKGELHKGVMHRSWMRRKAPKAARDRLTQ